MENKGWLAALGACSMLLSLAACGGGGGAGDGNTNNAVSASQGTPPAAGSATTGTTQTGSSSAGSTSTGCAPITNTSDAWLPSRLSCFTPGQKILSNTSQVAGPSRDAAIIVTETVFDAGFYNVLPGNKSRYYKYFACLKNVPDGALSTSTARLDVAGDIAITVRTSNGSTKGNQIGAITIGVLGGNQTGSAALTCDGSKHPLIIDYPTGKVLSVNPQALNAIETYDQ